MEYTIQTYELCKKSGDCSVVRNVSMHVPKGQIYGLLGRNGAGKTTIMKMEKFFEMSQNCDTSRVKKQRPVTFL